MTARDIFNGSTGNRARILILDADGLPKTGVAYNAAGLSIAYKIGTGSEVVITLTSGNWHETGGGKYLVDVADTVYAAGNLGALVQFYGALTSSSVYGEQHRVVAYNPLAVAVGANTTTPPTAGAIADAVYEEPYDEHKTPGTYGFLWDRWRKANPAINGEVVAGTLSTTQFSSDITTYGAEAFRGATLLFINGSTYAEFASPIVEYNPTGGVFTLEKALPTAPTIGDEFVVQPANYVHSIASIVSGVWSAATSGFSSVAGSTGLVVHAISTMIEFVSGSWRWVANSLSQAPTGGGGDGIYARTFAVSSPSGAVSGVAISVVGTAIRVTTGTSGEATVNLDPGTYTIRFGVPPGFAQQADLTLAVSASGTTSVTLTPVSVPSPPSANSCLLSVYVRNQSTEPADGITVQARLPKGWSVQGNTFNLNEIITDVTDSAGLAQLYLMRSTKYELSFSRANGTIAKISIETPDAATANLSQVYTE